VEYQSGTPWIEPALAVSVPSRHGDGESSARSFGGIRHQGEDTKMRARARSSEMQRTAIATLASLLIAGGLAALLSVSVLSVQVEAACTFYDCEWSADCGTCEV